MRRPARFLSLLSHGGSHHPISVPKLLYLGRRGYVHESRALSRLSGGAKPRPYGHRPRSGVGEGFAHSRTSGLSSRALGRGTGCRRSSARNRFISLMLVLLLLATASCGGTGKPDPEAPKPKAGEIRREYRRGPMYVCITADKDAISIAENILLTIEAETADGYEAELPRFGEKLGEFGIRDYREHQPRLTPEGKVLTGKVYTLEPFLSGDYTIAPMQVRFRKKTDATAGAGTGSKADTPWEHEITSEEITIRVNSLLEKDQKELVLNPIKGPVGLPNEPFSPLTILAGVGAAGLIACGAFFLFKRRRAAMMQHTDPVLPPHELAYRQLQEIIDERLIERGELKLFFSKISDVLRSYIENRFGIHAPKRTTEEFLSDIGRDASFPSDYKGLLVGFLQNCDLVKFAEHFPSPEEAAKAVDSCRAFVDATRDSASPCPSVRAPEGR